MSQTGTCGDHITLQIVAQLYNVNIVVISSHGPGHCAVVSAGGNFDDDAATLFLGHWPEGHGEHYLSLDGALSDFVGSGGADGEDIEVDVRKQGVRVGMSVRKQGVRVRVSVRNQVVRVRVSVRNQVVIVRVSIRKQVVRVRVSVRKQGVRVRMSVRRRVMLVTTVKIRNTILRTLERAFQFWTCPQR
ncbi:Uncharacterised protein r2_g3891 [Pycnogonum litorale]